MHVAIQLLMAGWGPGDLGLVLQGLFSHRAM